ncbi:hypothetical protein Taro_015603 [Colocasia esculenta]|uniref:Uncharacterized protein n=1 Tax=Colocasia esculenta TaxID=4460 RepID=A0A843ULN6_COLES|nr:hypothetical protein [Colocasia esculenta]
MLGFLVIVLLLLLLPTILLALSSSGSSHSRRHGAPSAPPGNTGWPLIGETIAFLKPHPSTSIGDFLVQRVSRFGNVFTSNLFGQPTVVSADAQLNRFILQNESKAFGPGWPRSLIKVLGRYTILDLAGDDHRYMRSIVVNFLSSARLQTVFLKGVERAATATLGSWKGNGVVSATEEARKFTFALIAKAILSMETNNADTEKLEREFETFSKGLTSLPLNFPGTAHWNSLKARSNILNVIRQKREERINKLRDGRIDVEDDLLTWTLENSNYTEEQTGDFLLGFLFGGHDTSAKSIALAIYFLDGCPKALKQMQEEHHAIVERKKEKEKSGLGWEDYKQLEFTHCVFYESLRLGNIAKYVQRKAVKDFQYEEHIIPQGFSVMAAFWAVHMDPSLFEDPRQFNPWRWKGPSGIKKSNNFMAFGGGSRLCPGAELAKLEFVVFFHHLIMNYRWELVEPDHPFSRPHVDFAKGLHIKIHTLENQVEKVGRLL